MNERYHRGFFWITFDGWLGLRRIAATVRMGEGRGLVNHMCVLVLALVVAARRERMERYVPVSSLMKGLSWGEKH